MGSRDLLRWWDFFVRVKLRARIRLVDSSKRNIDGSFEYEYLPKREEACLFVSIKG